MLRKRLRPRLLGSLLAAAAAALLATPASAGTYTVNSCGKSATGSMEGWSFDATAGTSGYSTYFYTANACDAYGIYRRFNNVTIPAGAYAAWTFTAPADTHIQSAKLFQTINYRSSGAYDSVIAERSDGTRTLVASLVGTGDASAAQYDTTYTMPGSGSRTVALRTELGCQASANCYGYHSSGVTGNAWSLFGSVIELVDPSTPSFTTVSGPGWVAEPADGVNAINYTVTDAGAGVREVRYYLDGIEYGANASGCTAGRRVPCPLSGSGRFVLDTTRLAEGQHTIALVAADYSGNETALTEKQLTITVRRAPAPSGSSPVSTSNPSWNGGGSPAVGDRLTGNVGGWSGSDNTYTYQWQRCDAQGLNCTPIDGATGLSYTATPADVGSTLQFCVTASNSGGSVTSCSAPTPVVAASHPATAPGTSQDALPASTDTSFSSPPKIVTQAPGRGSPNGSGATDRVVLTAITNNRSATRKVKFGKRVPITGRLLSASGAPIAGATLAVQTQTAVPGGSMADTAQVLTGPDGRFSYTAPAGPSRVVRFGYRAYTADSAFADTTDINLLVSAGVTMKATPKKVRNRHATVFTGRLLGKPISKRGVVVDLQVFFRKQWRTFAAPRTNKKGVYRFKYRFMAGAATWKFRARVRKDGMYPYEIGFSTRQVKVKVTR